MKRKTRGFSLIELLIVVAIITTLTGGTVMVFGDTFTYAEQRTLRHNQQILRRAIDDFHSDKLHYPASLSELVEQRYLREIPLNPVDESPDSWVCLPSKPGVCDVWDVRPMQSEREEEGK